MNSYKCPQCGFTTRAGIESCESCGTVVNVSPALIVTPSKPEKPIMLEARQEIELFALILQAMKDNLLSDEEIAEIDLTFNNSCLKQCTFKAIKAKAFKQHVTPHLYHTRITDTQLEVLAHIGKRLEIDFDCLYALTGQPRRMVNIF